LPLLKFQPSYDSVNHTSLAKEDHLSDWACQDIRGKKGDRVDYVSQGLCNPKGANISLLTYSMEQGPSWEANWFCS